MLPRKPTVAQLLHGFKKEALAKDRQEEQQLEEVIAGLKLYFNRALGSMLLYRFERQQYADIRKKCPKKDMSDIYGAEHLLRIFGNVLIGHLSKFPHLPCISSCPCNLFCIYTSFHHWL